MDKSDGEQIYEKKFSRQALQLDESLNRFDLNRLNYPRFLIDEQTECFWIPIKEAYHDILYPDLKLVEQLNLFENIGFGDKFGRAGNTIRKVYLCRSRSSLGAPGSILLFYKGRSNSLPSRALTVLGILEDVRIARGTKDLLQMTGGRSVYSERDLEKWAASPAQPVKVINFLLCAYLDPPVELSLLQQLRVVGPHPPQSIKRINLDFLNVFLAISNLGFSPR